jgi:uncharacterized protein (DUF608 family)
MSHDPTPERCNCKSGCCEDVSRRDFVKLLGAAGAAASGLPVMAGPFVAADFQKLVPADKKLSPEWVASLTARGQPTVYRGPDLAKIGMPVGGICAGQVYLGGDGKLWHWDIFNQRITTGGSHYAKPLDPTAPFDQGFAVKTVTGGRTQVRVLDHTGFSEITFRGEYPIGRVTYGDPDSPVSVALEAFSPFVPLVAEDSALPATVMRFTVKNTGRERVEAELAGWLENAVGLYSGFADAGSRQNAVRRGDSLTALECSATAREINARPDLLFEDFQKKNYEGWEVTGTAFGSGPVAKKNVPAYQGDLGAPSPRFVNSHASAPGSDVGARDNQQGTLTSRPFEITRNFITFWIGGGQHAGKTCINLLVDGKAVRTASGHNSNRMRAEMFDVRSLQGRQARLEIVDHQGGAWGNIGIARIVFTDRPTGKLVEQGDWGTMALALLSPGALDRALPAVGDGHLPEMIFLNEGDRAQASAEQPFGEKLVGALVRRLSLDPGQEALATFVITWHFPNCKLKDGGRFYANRFPTAGAVADYVAANFDRLAGQTRLWRDTWYDSTLPYWFLDRTFANTSILASSTCLWFKTGRFYGWEGVGCCEGTCTHVWHYAHAVARLFPQLERDLRERTDFGTALNLETGVINHRGEGAGLAVDGQAGCILRAYREHQMSADVAFLRRLWPKIKLAMQCLVSMDDGRGLLEGPQHNTLDQPWFGRVAWLSSLYLAAARACEEMAREMGDQAFAQQMRQIVERGAASVDRELFNGQYYYHIPDAEHQKSVGSHNGCEIDQVFGESWSWQVGLGRMLSQQNVKQALASLWRYNFTPDVGPYREAHKPGRWYAMAGEAGLLMCSWPQGEGARVEKGFDFYFNECMTGFEYQVAWHMIAEGMLTEGLAITRAIHDRYHASRRNPWNEVECGDHYARAMASYGVFLAACGYEYHGPQGHLGFNPRLGPDDFRAAFTTAQGWGTFSQRRQTGRQTERIELKSGQLELVSLEFTLAAGAQPAQVTVSLNGQPVGAKWTAADNRVQINLGQRAKLDAGHAMEVVIG